MEMTATTTLTFFLLPASTTTTVAATHKTTAALVMKEKNLHLTTDIIIQCMSYWVEKMGTDSQSPMQLTSDGKTTYW